MRLLKILGALTIIRKEEVKGHQRKQVRDRVVISAAGGHVWVSVTVCVIGAADSVFKKGNSVFFF